MPSLRRVDRPHAMNPDRWDDYLASFHDERAGITEAILGRAAADDASDPYDWLLDALPADGVIVDVACGSAPLAARATRGWVGLHRNRAELDLAVRVAPGRVLLADATSAPLCAGAADAVVCSMALMVFDDPGRVVSEMARLLRGGGGLVALLPATAPLTMRDRVRYTRLLAALRLRRLPFRHHRLLENPLPPITAAGLTPVSADRRPLRLPAHRARRRSPMAAVAVPAGHRRPPVGRRAASRLAVDRLQHRNSPTTPGLHQGPLSPRRHAGACSSQDRWAKASSTGVRNRWFV